jgi:hypothetical protein
MLVKTVIQDVSKTLHLGYDVLLLLAIDLLERRGSTNNIVNNNCRRGREQQQLGDRDFLSVLIDYKWYTEPLFLGGGSI